MFRFFYDMSNTKISFYIVYFTLIQIISWYYQPLFSFVAFIPIFSLLLSNYKYNTWLCFIFILILNHIVIFWIYEIGFFKGIASIFGNSLVMLLPFYITIQIKKHLSFHFILPIFIFLWILTEILHHYWFLSFTWLILGNIFSINTKYIQWYEYTTVIGGTFWVLICNLILYYFLSNRYKLVFFIVFLFISLFPIYLSLKIIKNKNNCKKESYLEVLIVNAIFENKKMTDQQKMKTLLKLIHSKISKNTDYILLPETIFSENIWETEIQQSIQYITLKNILVNYPKTKVIIGANLNKITSSKESHLKNSIGISYKKYNVAIEINTNNTIKIKEKDVFVPIEEYIPPFLSFINIPSLYLSKSSSNNHSFNIDKNKSIFISICYEMVNSFFVKTKIKNSDQIIFMLANESFFNQSEIGRWQYWNICKLRSIENRKYIVKSSSRGYAGLIDDYGKDVSVIKPTENRIMKLYISF